MNFIIARGRVQNVPSRFLRSGLRYVSVSNGWLVSVQSPPQVWVSFCGGSGCQKTHLFHRCIFFFPRTHTSLPTHQTPSRSANLRLALMMSRSRRSRPTRRSPGLWRRWQAASPGKTAVTSLCRARARLLDPWAEIDKKSDRWKSWEGISSASRHWLTAPEKRRPPIVVIVIGDPFSFVVACEEKNDDKTEIQNWRRTVNGEFGGGLI